MHGANISLIVLNIFNDQWSSADYWLNGSRLHSVKLLSYLSLIWRGYILRDW